VNHRQPVVELLAAEGELVDFVRVRFLEQSADTLPQLVFGHFHMRHSLSPSIVVYSIS
jgi:hypothetical protein